MNKLDSSRLRFYSVSVSVCLRRIAAVTTGTTPPKGREQALVIGGWVLTGVMFNCWVGVESVRCRGRYPLPVR